MSRAVNFDTFCADGPRYLLEWAQDRFDAVQIWPDWHCLVVGHSHRLHRVMGALFAASAGFNAVLIATGFTLPAVPAPDLHCVTGATDIVSIAQRQTLDIQTWDCITTPIQWWDAGPDRYQTEVFGFLRIEFEYPLGGTVTPAWIIDCYNSQAHGQPQFYEIIAEHIEGVSYFRPCRIHIPEHTV